jgi:two-component system sensor histidine kinase ChiS
MSLILAAFYIPFFKPGRMLLIAVVLFSGFTGSYFVCQIVPPYYQLHGFALHSVYILSLFGFTFSIIYIPYFNTQAYRLVTNRLSATLAQNAELERLSKLKDDFLANTSHELRTPLHGISGIAESLRNDASVQSSPFLSNNLGHIITSARRLTNLVNDILDFSKMRHNDLVIKPRPLDIEQITTTVLPNFSSAASKKGIILTTNFSADLPGVYADEDRMIQIIFNLVGNAIKFTDKGSITISAHSDSSKKQLKLCVADTGIGIAEEDLSTIFDAFEQASFSRNDYRGGTGLGLSITKKLIELHNGTISVNSQKGIGTTFTVILPSVEKEKQTHKEIVSSPVQQAFIIENDSTITSAQNTQTSSTNDKDASSKRRVILAIDDEPINLQIVRNQLEPLGINVVTAENGLSILELIAQHNPTVVLLDIMMPGMNGYECCRIIRNHYSIADLPVVFISAKNRISDLVLGFEAGGNEYVLKPFLREELVARVEGQIRQREAVDAIREIADLKAELAERLIEEAQLQQKQEQLTRLLHSVDDALMIVDDDGEIVFANCILNDTLGYAPDTPIAGRDASSLLHPNSRQNNLLTAKLSKAKSVPVLFSSADGNAVELSVKRTPIEINEEHLFVFSMRKTVKEINNSRVAEWVLTELERNQERIAELKNLGTELIEANKHMMEQLTLGETQKADPFALGNRIMVDTLTLWKDATGKEKWEFAEKSGLWKVHPDEDGWQRTATLDKYLDFRKMPKFPRWITVIESARFVLQEVNKLNFVSEKTKCIEQNLEELEGVLKGTVAV